MWATALGTMAFNMQDIILEPYGGEILKLSVGATSALTAMLAGGGLLGFYVAGRKLASGIDPMRLAAYGALAGLPAFSAVIFSAPLEAGWLFQLWRFWRGLWRWLVCRGHLVHRHASWSQPTWAWPWVPGAPCNRQQLACPCSLVVPCEIS